MRLLVTRPLPDGERTATALRQRGHDALLAPLLCIELNGNADFGRGPFAAVLMTSANAARALAAHPQRASIIVLPLFAVGRQTADAARAAGFTNVVSADGNAGDLAVLVSARGAGGAVLYLAAEDRAGDLAGDLKAHGIVVTTVAIYRAVAAASFPGAARAAIETGTVDGVLHFSRRSAAVFSDLAGKAGLADPVARLRHYCLSGAVAAPLTAAGATDVRIASRPDEAAVLDLIPRA